MGLPGGLRARLWRDAPAMTPKQCAAKLLLNVLTTGAAHPKKIDRILMGETLGLRISDDKRVKILAFVEKLESPFTERLTRLAGMTGEADEASDASDEAK